MEELTTKVTAEDIRNGVEDEFGVVYSRDGKRLLKYKVDKKNTSLIEEEKNDQSYYVIHQGTEVICDHAFAFCKSLQRITIPDSVTVIGIGAFSNCTQLEQATLPNSVTCIKGFAFRDCVSLQQLTIPESIRKIDCNPFEGCSNLKLESKSTWLIVTDGFLIDNKKILISYTGNNESVVIPDMVTMIDDFAFRSCKNLQQVILPNTVTEIGSCAFENCESLTKLTIPESVMTIGFSSFNGCTNLQLVVKSPCFVYINGFLIDNKHSLISYTKNDKSVIIPEEVTTIGVRAFSDCKKIQQIIIPQSVTTIDNSAFYGCESLQKVTIPTSVVSIGNGAFTYCESLKQIIIPKSVITIGDNAFESCESLQKITIPDSVVSIGNGAFKDCKSLKSILISILVTSIGDNAFESCESLQKITIPTSVVSIGNYTFKGCSALTKIEIPQSVTTIGMGAFSSCTSLKVFSIPQSVTTIEECVFYECKSLYKIYIPQSVTSIEKLAFSCTALEQITIPDNVTTIGIGVFYECKSLHHISIPQSVTSIGELAFSRTALEQITIPDSVTTIGIGAFSKCKSLHHISIPQSVTSIGESAFSHTALEQITIPNNVSTIENGVFSSCTSLKSISIPQSVTSIGDYAFDSCKDLEQISIPDNVTIIGNNAFKSCTSLTQVIIPQSVTSIGNCAFMDCYALKQITISAQVMHIGHYAFYECKSLQHIYTSTFEDSSCNDSTALAQHNICNLDASIGDCAFSFCSDLDNITIPEKITKIGDCAFSFCKNLKEVNTKSVVTIGKYAFSFCNKLQTVSFSNSLKTIHDNAFAYCESLQYINFPETLTTIGKKSFLGCITLRDITIPKSVMSIDNNAFELCNSLEQITILNPNISIGNHIFDNCDSLPQNIIQKYNITNKIKIKKIIINNFRAYKKEEVDINDFNCIIGKNDSGKTTIFAALEWFFDIHRTLNENDFSSVQNTGDNYDDLFVSVEVYFCDVAIPDSVIFEQDYLSENKYLCIRKYMYHPKSKYWGKMGYSIKTYPLKNMKLISNYSLKDLNKEYGERINKYSYFWEIDEYDSAWNLYSEIHRLNNSINAKSESEKTWDENKLKVLDKQVHLEFYNICINNGDRDILDDQWMDFDNAHSNPFHLDWFDTLKFYLYTSNTSLNSYLNSLFEIKYYKSIEDTKSNMVNELSEMLTNHNISDNLGFKEQEKIELFSDNTLLFTDNIPLNNKGEGIQLQIKNAVFKILTGIQSENRNTIFAFEEPETHLHPGAQREMYKTIKELSENPNYQVFITTHSPYIVKQLAEDNIKPIVVKRDENLKLSTISKLEERVLPYISMNEINYIAFEEPSIEYHIELFGYIHNKLIYRYENDNSFKTYWNATMTKPNRNGVQKTVPVTSIKGVDVWFENCCAAKKYKWFETDNYSEERRTLPYCVRNNIDHPLKTDDASKANGHKAFVNNNKYFKQWIIAKSIEIMRNAILNNPDIFK